MSTAVPVPPPAQEQFSWYLFGAGAWFVAIGIQMVMFTYLVTTVLHAAPNMIGLAQASLTIVSTFLLLFGGAMADQVDKRQLLIRCHLFAALPPLALAAVVSAGTLRYEWLIAYGLAMGLVTAFVIPTREAMMADVIGPDRRAFVQRAVTTTVGVTFLGQIAGMFLARFAAEIGPEPIMLFQAGIQLFGAYTVYRLMPTAIHATEAGGAGVIARIADGVREVAGSYALLPITIITSAIGILFIGSFLVVLPVILREEFGGNVQQISSMQIAFWSGSIISSIAISRLGNIVNRGRMVVFAVSTGTTILFLLSFKAPLPVLYGLVFIWGLGAGVMISMSRTIVQEHAPAAHRARVMSIFQLGFTGGMSIGALLIGFVVDALGARHATWVPAGSMAVVLICLLTFTKLWTITALKHEPDASS
ncbi:MAG: MFS transporter [Alphaproteobacteria bacterium]|nr:MFS transporter [Alphaproteobacteria bacterium]